MRWWLTTALGTLSMAVMAAAAAAEPLSLRVLTSNIRYAAPGDAYEKPWSVRGPLLIERVAGLVSGNATAATVIGMQEVLHEQLLDILAGLDASTSASSASSASTSTSSSGSALSSGSISSSASGASWSYLGTGRDDGDQAGEYCPLFYQPARTALLASTQKWLSPTPDVPSFWPGAGSRRYVLAAVFQDIASNTKFIAANTHLDNVSSAARSEGVKIVLRVIRDMQAQWGMELPVVLSGDFNSEPGEDAYAAMVADGYLQDAYVLAPEKGGRFGPYETYTGFVPDEIPDVSGRIDFLWLGPDAEDTWDVRRYEVVDNVVGGVFFSDHRPVFVDVTLRA
ncbi:endonuclease/exonuclease/phosphatase [Xylaria sp. FL0933]|nr:endonuclease/exonuclease/phosphatase [Xylaria sp. FL0933]